MKITSKVNHSPEVYSECIDGVWYLLPNGSDEYIQLNDSAGYIWFLAKKPILVSKIITSLVKEYQVKPEQAEQDVLELLSELQAEKLIEVS